jgi:hypothetical protein
MRVFTDFHHAGLLSSLQMLFEDRLGGELYRPIGMGWFDQGYWKLNDQLDTARQYLEIGNVPLDGTLPLNESTTGLLSPTINGVREAYMCKDIDSGGYNKAITLEEFARADFDILIASLPQHIQPFKKLIEIFQPKAKLIYQIGNQWDIPASLVKNVMCSAKLPDLPKSLNVVEYHQEFDLSIFKPEPPSEKRKVYSFVNCLGTADLFKKDWELFLKLEELMPNWEFKSFGGQCRDGSMKGSQELADKMREATFIFHCKTGGDGYGHVIHNAAAVGRPLIVRKADYEGKLAQSLIHPSTSILVDNLSPEDIAYEIEEGYRFRESYSSEMYKTFKEAVDFDREEQEIRKFLDQLE